jgi:predicted glycosyltransferase involved in capsule biosynthesis
VKQLTIVASNRDRFDINTNSTKWFIKSLEHQTCKDFELLIADGGSKNLDDIKSYCDQSKIDMRVVEFQLGEKFERARLNNVGVRNAKTPYILTTDVDLFFAPKFVEILLDNCKPNLFIESRTMYWKPPLVQKIYKGILNPFEDLEACKIGRIKKRTTAGGCQCASIDQWTKVRGFDERYVGWGSEDYDLLTRMNHSGAKVMWLGERRENIMVFHQPHSKNVKEELKEQENNKRLLNKINGYKVNPNGWGGIKDENV